MPPPPLPPPPLLLLLLRKFKPVEFQDIPERTKIVTLTPFYKINCNDTLEAGRIISVRKCAKTLPVTKSICESSLRVFNISATFSEDAALPAQDILPHRNLRMRRQCNNLLKLPCHCPGHIT